MIRKMWLDLFSSIGSMVWMPIYESPCKVNLSLRVLSRRSDGFHEVDTLMAPVGLYDRLSFSPAVVTSLSCDAAGVPLDESNLVLKAVRVMERELGRSVHWAIHLDKRIPHGAGLGGGSGNAAATLVALNELENAGMPKEKLVAMSSELGSDVGFFVDGGICRCTGRGEIVTPVPEYSGFSGTLLLVKPSFGVSTPDAYKRWMGSSPLPGVDYCTHAWSGIEFVNDLERPVFEKFLFLAEVKTWLARQSGVSVSMMSGSGSTMFAFVESVERANELSFLAKAELDPTLWSWVGSCGRGCGIRRADVE